jgi:hypothetical protein
MNWDKARAAKRNEHVPLQSGRSYIDERKPITDPQRRLIRALRTELGVSDEEMPETNREARKLISALIDRKKAA